MALFSAGVYRWPSKKEALKWIGNWLRSKVPVFVVDNPEDLLFLNSLIQKHPDAENKIGCGVARFEVRQNPIFANQNTLYLIRIDGTETDFSFRICVSGKHTTAWIDFCAAARFAIADQILVYKVMRFTSIDSPVCWITGEELNPDNCHVDHVISFNSLIRRFVDEFTVDHVGAIRKSGDGDVVPQFADEAVRTNWQEFHRANAVLNLATAKANMSRGAQ